MDFKDAIHWFYGIFALVYFLLWHSEILYCREHGPSKLLPLVNVVYCVVVALAATRDTDITLAFLLALTPPSVAATWHCILKHYFYAYPRSQIATDKDGNSVLSPRSLDLMDTQSNLRRTQASNNSHNLNGIRSRLRASAFALSSSTSSPPNYSASSDTGSFPDTSPLTPSSSTISLEESPIFLTRKKGISWDLDPEGDEPSARIGNGRIYGEGFLVPMGLVSNFNVTSSFESNDDCAAASVKRKVETRLSGASRHYGYGESSMSGLSQISVGVTTGEPEGGLGTSRNDFTNDPEVRSSPTSWDMFMSPSAETEEPCGDSQEECPELEFDLLTVSRSFCVLSQSPPSGTDVPYHSRVASNSIGASTPDPLPWFRSSERELPVPGDETNGFEVEKPRHGGLDSRSCSEDAMPGYHKQIVTDMRPENIPGSNVCYLVPSPVGIPALFTNFENEDLSEDWGLPPTSESSFCLSPSASKNSLALGERLSFTTLLMDMSMETSDVQDLDFAPLDNEEMIQIPFLELPDDAAQPFDTTLSSDVTMFNSSVDVAIEDYSVILTTSLDMSEVYEEDFAPITDVPLLTDTGPTPLVPGVSEWQGISNTSSSHIITTATEVSLLMDGPLNVTPGSKDDSAHSSTGENNGPVVDSPSLVISADIGGSFLVDASLTIPQGRGDDFDPPSSTEEHGCMFDPPSFTIPDDIDGSLLINASIIITQGQEDYLDPPSPLEQPSFLVDSPSFMIPDGIDGSLLVNLSLHMTEGHEEDLNSLSFDTQSETLAASHVLPPESSSTCALEILDDISALLDISMPISQASTSYQDEFAALSPGENAPRFTADLTLEAAANGCAGILGEDSLLLPEIDDDDFAPLSVEEQNQAMFLFRRNAALQTQTDERGVPHRARSPAHIPNNLFRPAEVSLSGAHGTPGLGSWSSSTWSLDTPGLTFPRNATDTAECGFGTEDKASREPPRSCSSFEFEYPEAYLERHGKRLGKARMSIHSTLAVLAMHNNLALKVF